MLRCINEHINRTVWVPPFFYFQGLGTDDKTLIRVVVSRCEVDMVQIKDEFGSAYGHTLEQFIKVCIHYCDVII